MTKKLLKKMGDDLPLHQKAIKTFGVGILSLSLFSSQFSLAQETCENPEIISVSVTEATCPGNGSITVAAATPGGAESLFYSIISGPTEITDENDNGVFSSLAAGTYTLRVRNPLGTGCHTDTVINVANGYEPFTFSLSVNNFCAGAAATINVSPVTSALSSLPLSYAYWKGDPAALDGTLSYSSSPSFDVPEGEFGIWNVRVKDACGEAVNHQITVSNPYPENMYIEWVGAWTNPENPLTCDSDEINAWVRLESDGVWVTHSSLPAEGVQIKIYENLAESGCVPLEENYVGTEIIGPGSGSDILIPRNKKLILVLTTPCEGAIDTFCYNGVTDQRMNGSLAIGQNSCLSTDLVNINMSVNDFAVRPVTYTIVSTTDPDFEPINGTFPPTAGWSTVSGIPYGESYTVTLTDACGQSVERYIEAPGPGDPLMIQNIQVTRDNCTKENGKVTALLTLDGYFPGLSATASTFAQIIAGPDAPKDGVREGARRFYFYDLIPGETYTLRIYSTECEGAEETIEFTVPSSTAPALTQGISLSVEQLCGSEGKGNITVNSTYNGSGWPQVKLYKSGETSPLYTLSGGQVTIPNLDEGTYYATLEVSWGESYGCAPYYISSDIVTILPGNTNPVITKKVPMVCENPVGNSDEGRVSLEFIGAGPFIVEYKLDAAEAWSVFETESTGAEMITGLTVNATYNVRITDACGNITTDNVTVGTMGMVNTTNTVQPCIGQPYTVQVPRFAGASYSWTKDGVSLSETGNEVAIPIFSESNTGTYVCEIVISECLVRTATITLYSEMCDENISQLSIAGNVFNDANGLNDNKVNGSPTNAGGILYAVLTDDENTVIGSVPVNADGTYIFTSVPQGNYYVVLRNGKPSAGQIITSSSLPDNWVSTGEHIGSPDENGHDDEVNGISEAILLTDYNIENVNFGVNQLPESYDEIQHINGAPEAGVLYALDQNLRGSDPEDTDGADIIWENKTVKITELPSNGFELLYNGEVVMQGQVITELNPELFSVRMTEATPEGTDQTIFYYSAIDNAGFEDPTPDSYTVIFSETLPVELIRFEAIAGHCQVAVEWQTAGEDRFSHFQVERSENHGATYSIVSEKIQGNGSHSTYSFTDLNVVNEIYLYRLLMTDNDGKMKYSAAIKADLSGCDNRSIRLIPNPTSGDAQVSGVEEDQTIHVYNALGRVIEVIEVMQGQNSVSLDTHHLPAAIYYITISDKNGRMVHHEKLIKK